MADDDVHHGVPQLVVSSALFMLLASHISRHWEGVARIGHRSLTSIHTWWHCIMADAASDNIKAENDVVQARILELKSFLSQTGLRYFEHGLVVVVPLVVKNLQLAKDRGAIDHYTRQCVYILGGYLIVIFASRVSPKYYSRVYVLINMVFVARSFQISLSGEQDVTFIRFYGRAGFMRFGVAVLCPVRFSVVVISNLIFSGAIQMRFASFSHTVQNDSMDLVKFAVNEAILLIHMLVGIHIFECWIENYAKKSLELESRDQAISTLLRGFCDGVVKLDSDCNISRVDPNLMHLLAGDTLRDDQALHGKSFAQYLATDTDKARFLEFVSFSMHGTSALQQSPVALHVHLQHCSGAHFPIQILCARLASFDDNPGLLLGIREEGRFASEAHVHTRTNNVGAQLNIDGNAFDHIRGHSHQNVPVANEDMFSVTSPASSVVDTSKAQVSVVFDALSDTMEIHELTDDWEAMCGCTSRYSNLAMFLGEQAASRFSLLLQPLVNAAIGGQWHPMSMCEKKFSKVLWQSVQDGYIYKARLSVTVPDPLIAYDSEEQTYLVTCRLIGVRLHSQQSISFDLDSLREE